MENKINQVYLLYGQSHDYPPRTEILGVYRTRKGADEAKERLIEIEKPRGYFEEIDWVIVDIED